MEIGPVHFFAQQTCDVQRSRMLETVSGFLAQKYRMLRICWITYSSVDRAAGMLHCSYNGFERAVRLKMPRIIYFGLCQSFSGMAYTSIPWKIFGSTAACIIFALSSSGSGRCWILLVLITRMLIFLDIGKLMFGYHT